MQFPFTVVVYAYIWFMLFLKITTPPIVLFLSAQYFIPLTCYIIWAFLDSLFYIIVLQDLHFFFNFNPKILHFNSKIFLSSFVSHCWLVPWIIHLGYWYMRIMMEWCGQWELFVPSRELTPKLGIQILIFTSDCLHIILSINKMMFTV